VVRKGTEKLRLVKIEERGWRTFHGKHGTRIRLRRGGPNTLDVDYFAIVEPADGEVDLEIADRFWCPPGNSEPVGIKYWLTDTEADMQMTGGLISDDR
jgi:hypothetical protein